MVHIVNQQVPPSPPGGTQSVDRALALLSLIGRQPERGVSLTALVAESGLNKPTARRLVLALMRAGLVEQNPDSRLYRLGEEAYVLGTLAARRHGLLEMAGEALRRLARETGDTAFVSVRRDTASVCLHREEGTYPIRTHALMPGNHHPLGVGAGSLAMLAALPEEEAEAVLGANAGVLASDYPGLATEMLRDHVARTRAAGYATNPGLIFPDSWGIGVALRRPDGTVAGAVSLAAIESRMQTPRREELARLLQAEAEQIEKRLAQVYAARSANGGDPAR
ncbi:IclR family transcriptional regulator [Tranquillimonas alkanivorans]|uniref:IclR family transcriptional regulator n=1 Tax=Tranquillimonas alkanivorans TaxID=441119 RepID=UPI001FE105AE|nr:IclR family transcriptional regulator [Tranquillimonas alkanivorans]